MGKVKDAFESELERLTERLMSVEAGEIDEKTYSKYRVTNKGYQIVFKRDKEKIKSDISKLFEDHEKPLDIGLVKLHEARPRGI